MASCSTMDSLIPGLPDDAAKLCIARVPLKLHALLCTVCRSWKSWLTQEDEELANLRRDAGLRGDQLYLLVCKSISSMTESLSREGFSNCPWLWNGRCFAKFSYSLVKVELSQKGQVIMENLGEEFACKVSWWTPA